MAKKNNTASNNPYSGPVRYQYNPINYAAYAEPLLNHQQQYDKTMSALDETNYDIAHMTQDKELTDKMEKGLQGDLDKVSKDLLANADYRGAARKLSKLNKFYNNDDHMNAVRSSYASEQALMKELNDGDYTADYKQKRLATERGNFKGTSFDEGSYNIFNPGVNYKDYTDEIKDEVESLLSKNPTEVREYLTKGRKLNAYQTRMMEEKIEQNDFDGLYNIAIATVTGNPKYAASIRHRAGLDYDYLALDNPEWAAEKYGKDLAQFDEAIANAKNEEDRSTLRDNKAELQEEYEKSQGDYYKSLHAQQMISNMVRPIAANFTEYKQTLGGGFTYDNDLWKKWTDKEKAKQQVKKAMNTNVISIYTPSNIPKVVTTDILSNAYKSNAGLGVNAKQDIVGKFSGLDATIKESKVAVTTLAGDITSSQTELRNKQNAYGANPTDEQKEELAQLQNTVNKQTTDYQNLSGQLATSSEKLSNIKQQAIATLKETYPAEAAKYEKMSNEEFIAALSKDYGTSEVEGASIGDVVESIATDLGRQWAPLALATGSETAIKLALDLQEYGTDKEEITSDAINLLGTTFNNLYTEAQLDETILMSTNSFDYNGVKEISPQIEATANYIDNADQGDLSNNVYITQIDDNGNYKTATDSEGNPIDLTSINLGSMKPISYGGNQTVSGEKGLEKDGFILNYAYDKEIDPKLANAFIYNQISTKEIDANFGDAKKLMFNKDGEVKQEYATAYNKFYTNNANKTFPLLITGTSTNTQEIPIRLLQDYKINQNPETLERYAESVALEFPQIRENYRNLAYEIRETLKSNENIAATPKIIEGTGNQYYQPLYKISVDEDGIKQVEYIIKDNATDAQVNKGIIDFYGNTFSNDLLKYNIQHGADELQSLLQ